MREFIFFTALTLCLATVAGAQTIGGGGEFPANPSDPPVVQTADAAAQPRLTIDLSRIALTDRSRTDRWLPRLDATQDSGRSSGRSATRKILGGIVGATGGFFAGGYTGAWIEGDRCHCDDPGLKGALIGAPIGAIVGGILGALFLF